MSEPIILPFQEWCETFEIENYNKQRAFGAHLELDFDEEQWEEEEYQRYLENSPKK